jgi:hypothetical protein
MAPPLFDVRDRTDASPAKRVEGSFAFLNRAAGIVWARQRELMDGWYDAHPDPDEDLRRRFRSPSTQQHYAAWWELYVHALLRTLGYTVTAHPRVPGTNGHPDFLAERPGESFYVEAATVFSGIVSPTRSAQLKGAIEDALETVEPSTFYVALRWDRVGDAMPRRREIVEPVRAWVATLDAETVRATEEDGRSPERWQRFECGDWAFSLRPHVWTPHLLGCPNNVFLGMMPPIAGVTNDVPMIQRAVTRKGKRYGTPDKPLVVAVLATNGFVNDRDVTASLFGSEVVRVNVATGVSTLDRNRDGVWIGKRGSAGRRISAVLMGVGILPGAVARTLPVLWHHYAPSYELAADLPFATARIVNDEVKLTDAKRAAAEVFDLPAAWPGPEPAFQRCTHRPEDHSIPR